MHFTVDYKRLVKMLELAKRKWPGQMKDKKVRMYACAARVFIEAESMTSGEEALVFRDGGCRLPLASFLKVLKTYSYKENVTIEADEKVLKMFSTNFPVLDFTPHVNPPASFVVGRVS